MGGAIRTAGTDIGDAHRTAGCSAVLAASSHSMEMLWTASVPSDKILIKIVERRR